MKTIRLANPAASGGALSQRFSAITNIVGKSLGVQIGCAKARLTLITVISASFVSSAYAATAPAVTLAWDANPESGIAAYQLRYGTSSGVYPNVVNPGTITTATVPGLTEGMTYYFVVSAINQAGLQSPLSSEISYHVPVTPTVPIPEPPVAEAPANTAPVFAVNPISATAKEDTAFSGQLAAADANTGDILTFRKISGPAWLTVSPAGVLAGTPPIGSAGTHEFTVRAGDSAGAYADAILQIKINPGLPLPWNLNRLGSANLAGTASYNAGIFTVAGSGALAKTADAANYLWQTLSGDGEIIARVSTFANTGSATRVGVMIRESLAANSRQAFIGVNNTGSFQWLRRTSTGGSTSTSSSKKLPTAAPWLRLVRQGNTLTAYKSSNGSTWTKVGAATVVMPVTCYIGLAVSSGSNTLLNTSQFSNVSVTP